MATVESLCPGGPEEDVVSVTQHEALCLCVFLWVSTKDPYVNFGHKCNGGKLDVFGFQLQEREKQQSALQGRTKGVSSSKSRSGCRVIALFMHWREKKNADKIWGFFPTMWLLQKTQTGNLWTGRVERWRGTQSIHPGFAHPVPGSQLGRGQSDNLGWTAVRHRAKPQGEKITFCTYTLTCEKFREVNGHEW